MTLPEPAPCTAAPPHLLAVFQDRACRSTALWLFVLMSSAYFLTAPGRIDIVDGAIRFDITHNLIELGRPILTHRLPVVQAPNLDFYAFYQFGTSILALPFVLLARWLAPGSINAEQFAFTLTTIPFSALCVSLLFLAFVRLGLARACARNWALLAGFGSMLWPYAGSTFDLAPQAFFLTLGILAGADALASGSRPLALLSGLAFFGLATIQESYLPLALPVVLAVPELGPRELLKGVLQNMRRPAFVWISAGVVFGLAAVLLYNAARFDDPFRTGRETVHHPLVGNPWVGLRGLLVSPAKSLFLYSPLHLLGIVGLARLLRTQTRWALPALATFLEQLAIVSCLAFWAGEWAWGPRYLVATSPLVLLGVPFAFVSARARAARWSLRALGVAAVCVQLLAISTDHQVYYLNRNFRPFFWTRDELMYDDSPLFRRPLELWKALRFKGYEPGMKLVPYASDDVPEVEHQPGPAWAQAYQRLKRSAPVVTSAMGRPPREILQQRGFAWLDDYYVLNAPRPWISWSLGLPPELRPVPWLPWVALGVFGCALSLWQLTLRGSLPRRRVAAELPSAETRTDG